VRDVNSEAVFMSLAAFCRKLNIGRVKGYELIRRGEIPSIKIGSTIAIPTSTVDELLAKARENLSA
jgi:excisionase family DNA binding protein